MSNSEIKSAFTEVCSGAADMVEILEEDFDEVSGGACGTFKCGVYQVA